LRQLGGDAHRAQDITQQVFIDLARKARTLTSHPSLLAWLYTSTHYVALKFIRTENRRHRREEEAYAMENLTASSAPAAGTNCAWFSPARCTNSATTKAQVPR
jgi:DNA-directed RNA polymerase specialized sigma24 family protein